MPFYTKPTLPKDVAVANLVPEGAGGTELTPKTRVVIINRGDKPYFDKYDARDYVVQPGYSEVEYEAAEHFRTRSVVPGTRDPITGKQEHFIAIPGIDSEERCIPLNEVEQRAAAAAPEAIDRSAMDPADRDVVVVPTQAARSRVAGGNRRVRQSAESNDGTALAPDALTPPENGEAMRQIARDAAEREQSE